MPKIGLLLAAVVGWGANSFAGEQLIETAAPVEDSGIYDGIWDLANLYQDDNNPVIQSLTFAGRFQFDYWNNTADQGSGSDLEIRRFRLGLKSKLFRNFTVHLESDISANDLDYEYNKLTEAYLGYSPSEAFNLKIGKHSVPFTMDGATSSKSLYTIDRSNVTNNFWFTEEYIPGVSVSGKDDSWQYRAGIYSAGSESPEFGDFDAGLFGIVSLGYNFAESLGSDKALLRADYVYQDPDDLSGFTRQHQQVGALVFEFEQGRFGLGAELDASIGYSGQPNLFGLNVMPRYNLSEKFQIVARYTYIDSNGDNGIQFGRYEKNIVAGRGDRYHEIYGGLNYFIYGHKLKWQTGVQYVTMDDHADDGGEYDGWQFVTGIRIGW